MSQVTFEDIRKFTVSELWEPSVPVTPRTALAHDFEIAGFDGRDFMEAYATRFGVRMTDFDWVVYFGPEVAGNPLGLVWYLWQRYVRGVSARDLVGLPELTLEHLMECANEGRWKPPAECA